MTDPAESLVASQLAPFSLDLRDAPARPLVSRARIMRTFNSGETVYSIL
jgi:hypothetical protein